MPIYYGAAYYPEQWPEESWDRDARLMQEAGINAVRLGEFAWGRMEKSEGNYNWRWLDRVLDLLHAHGVAFVLCTPTAGPPMWIVDASPGMLLVDYNRSTRPAGGRRHYCYNHPEFRRHSVRIAGALADRYANHPGLIGWEIDNELAQEYTGRCCCPVCERRFRSWLQDKYGTIEALNEAWGTVFWSQEYDNWDQIQAPREAIRPENPPLQPTLRLNPGWLLDYERFCSSSLVDYQNLQVHAIREKSAAPISHNGTGLSVNYVDYWELFQTLDRGGLDCYPSVVTQDYVDSSRNLAQARCMTANPSWILELSSGGGMGTWGKSGLVQAPPGALRLLAWQVFANGAELAIYFQWRIFAKGAEQLESAILDLDGTPRRKYDEIRRTSPELQRLAPWLDATRVAAQTALVWSYDAHWAHGIKPYNRDFSYNNLSLSLYRGLTELQAGVDVIPIQADLSKYRLVVLPAPILIDPDTADRLAAYVDGGGVLVTTFLTAVKDESNVAIFDRPLPGYLDELFGARVIEVDPGDASLPTTLTLETRTGKPEYSHSVWSDILEPHGAHVLGRLHGSYRAGEPVITRHRYGKGHAYYLGAWPEPAGLSAILADSAHAAGIDPPRIAAPACVEIVRRTGEGRDLTFLLNWSFEPARVTLDRGYRELIGGARLTGDIEMPAREIFAISAEDRSS